MGYTMWETMAVASLLNVEAAVVPDIPDVPPQVDQDSRQC